MKGNRGRSVKLRKLIRIDAYILLAVFLLTNTLPQRAAALGAYELWDVKFNWARPAVNYVLSKGYMAGVSATRFDPTGTVSRAQVAQVLYQKAGAPEVDLSQNVFRDVKPGSWYARAAVWCRENQVIAGVKPDLFAPDAPVTREQVCVMARNFCSEYLGSTLAEASEEEMEGYTDWPKVSSWAREAVCWANKSGFMSGTSENKLTPAGKATREELAQFIYNLDTKVLGLDPGPAEAKPPYNIKTTPLAKKGSTKIIAHRGGGGIATENTIEAFTRSGTRSYYGLECDVQRTRDGQYVVFHDDSLQHLTGMAGAVKDYTLKQLKSFRLYDTRIEKRVGGKNDRLYIPTLREYLKACRLYKKRAVIEFSVNLTAYDVYRIIEIVRSEKYLDKTIFVSFSMDLLIAARGRLPSQPLMLNYLEKSPTHFIPRLRQYHIDFNCAWTRVDRKLVQTMHINNIKLGCWTVNDKKTADKLISWGVDYITTDILE